MKIDIRMMGHAVLPFGLIAVSVSSCAGGTETKPNVLFILADDYGWNDLSCMGSKYYETPNMDRIAEEGILFTQAYAACQVSSPSRASILTGQYTTRHGVTDWIGEKSGEAWRSMGRHNKLLPSDYARQLALEEYTLPECLRDNGYTTFIAGKWHLGDEGFWPEDQGFDINIGGWSAGNPKGGYFAPYENPKLENGPDGEELSMRLANETVSFLKQQKKDNKNKPFFAYLSFYAVHGPIETTRDRWKYFRDKAEQMGIAETGFEVDRTLPVRQYQDNPVYAGLVVQMDDAIGVVLDALKELGYDKNTIVIFTSDNGGVVSGDAYATSLFPLRGGKGRQWEGGIRVPLLVRYPGCTKGTVCEIPVSGIDFYPTILDYACIPMPEHQIFDGVSIMPALEGKELAGRPLFWHYPHYGNQGGEPCSIIRDGDLKLIYYYEDSRAELYNLADDLSETTDISAEYPSETERLKGKLMEWLTETNAVLPVADSEYKAAEEAKVKERWRTNVLHHQESLRKDMLDPDWAPGPDWWGSLVTVD